ncbi:alcohol dehydrogenase catalytic domain-containing protein [Streptomyces sp. PD-S100-1]|uniref:alcohol dehydrogenase catalytic domain-containing protein n=1 Tax=Streptomyces sp. PD-S100-1 TaxID=3394351 RepID=UPI0039BD5EC0
MKGIVFPGDRSAVLKEFPGPVPGPGEVVLRIRASGMCGSDLHFYRGSVDFAAGDGVIQGHEPCGEVHAVGPGVGEAMARVGQRVMVHHYWGCQACRRCRAGWPQMCETAPAKTMAVTAHGGHAPYALVPAHTLLPLPDELSYRAGAAIGCGTGTAWGGIKRLGDIADTTTVVFGQGPVGLSATMFAAAMGARVIAVDIDAARLRRARAFGAHETLDPAGTDLVAAVGELTRGRGADVVLETSGRAGQDALSVLGTFGRACFLGLPGQVSFSAEQHYKKQWTLMTSWTMSTIEQARCANFAVAHRLPVDDLYSHAWTLDQAAEAYAWFDRQADGKGVFEFTD